MQADVKALAKLKDGKAAAIRQCEEKVSRVNNLKKTYNLELRQMSREERKPHAKKLQDFDAKLAELKQELKWAKTEGERGDLFSGAKGAEPDAEVSRDAMLAGAGQLQGQTKAATSRIQARLNDAKDASLALPRGVAGAAHRSGRARSRTARPPPGLTRLTRRRLLRGRADWKHHRGEPR